MTWIPCEVAEERVRVLEKLELFVLCLPPGELRQKVSTAYGRKLRGKLHQRTKSKKRSDRN